MLSMFCGNQCEVCLNPPKEYVKGTIKNNENNWDKFLTVRLIKHIQTLLCKLQHINANVDKPSKVDQCYPKDGKG